MPPLRRSAPVLLLAALLCFAWVGPLLHPTDPDALDLGATLAPASATHPLGTDESGRDVLARLMAGGQVSLAVGALASGVALVLGSLIGSLAGWRGGWVEAVLAGDELIPQRPLSIPQSWSAARRPTAQIVRSAMARTRARWKRRDPICSART